MGRLFLVIGMLVCAADAAGQQAASGGDPEGGRFGAPVLKYTSFCGQGAVMIGGRGGWNVTPSLVLGAGAYGTLTPVDAPEGVVPFAPGPLDVKMETFGFDLEYAPRPEAATHLTLTAFLGGAASHYVKDGTQDQHGETDFMLLVEPSVGVERMVARWLHMNLGVSYRLVHGVEQVGLETADMRGPSASLAAKVGRF